MKMCLLEFVWLLRTGMKNPWMEKALPIIEANPATPEPTLVMVCGP